MTSTRAKIVEEGNGLPDVGELIYHHDTDALYRVIRYSGIHTDGCAGNYVYAEVVVDDDTILTTREYDCLRPVLVELLADEADADAAEMRAAAKAECRWCRPGQVRRRSQRD